MAPFDRSRTTSCESVVVSIALPCTIFEIFDVGEYRDLEIYSISHCTANLCANCSLRGWNPQTENGIA